MRRAELPDRGRPRPRPVLARGCVVGRHHGRRLRARGARRRIDRAPPRDDGHRGRDPAGNHRERPLPHAVAAYRPRLPQLTRSFYKEPPWLFPCNKKSRVGAYFLGRLLRGVRRYPLVLMLEPLFRCNLACAGCGKIDYPDPILNQRLSVAECLEAVDECGAPVVVIAGGEPLLHREIDEIVEGILARKKFVYLCTNALLLEKKIDLFKPNPFFAWTVHLDGDQEDHDRSVCQTGVYDRAVEAIRLAKGRGFRVNINATLL